LPEFKVVISDPESRNVKEAKVKVKAVDNVPSVEGEKEAKALPIAKVSQKLKEQLNVDNLITLQVIRQEGDKKVKVKVHFTVQVDESAGDAVLISKSLAEKFGAEEFEAIAYRTKAFQLNVDQGKLNLMGLKIGDTFNLNVNGVNLKLKITGGSDNSGFPMRPDVSGAVKKKVLLAGPPGYYPVEDGERRRKTIRGNTLTNDIVQVNCVIVR
jgi:small subunit ribosomal protein S6e